MERATTAAKSPAAHHQVTEAESCSIGGQTPAAFWLEPQWHVPEPEGPIQTPSSNTTGGQTPAALWLEPQWHAPEPGRPIQTPASEFWQEPPLHEPAGPIQDDSAKTTMPQLDNALVSITAPDLRGVIHRWPDPRSGAEQDSSESDAESNLTPLLSGWTLSEDGGDGEEGGQTPGTRRFYIGDADEEESLPAKQPPTWNFSAGPPPPPATPPPARPGRGLALTPLG